MTNTRMKTRWVIPRRDGRWLVRFLSVFLLFGMFALTPFPGESQSTAQIHGLVRDADGQPLAQARVGVIEQETAILHEVLTDSEGKFRVENLKVDGRYRVIVTKYGYRTIRLDNIIPGTEEHALALEREFYRPLRATPSEPSSTGTDAPPEDLIELATEMVVLNVSVKDSSGNPVLRLLPGDFSVFEDDAQQELVYFQETSPLSVVLLMDSSSSMKGNPLKEAKEAALEFVEKGAPDDEVALVAFSDRVNVLKEFTRDHAVLRAAIDKLEAKGGTALYDAIAAGIELLEKARYPHRAIVLLSDGQDEDSKKKFANIEELVRSTFTVLFAIGEYDRKNLVRYMKKGKYYKEPELDVNLNPVWVLRQLADVSGGAAFFPLPGESVAPFFALIARELRQQYVVGYIAPEGTGHTSYRRIEVRAASSRYPGPLMVRTRQGYIHK